MESLKEAWFDSCIELWNELNKNPRYIETEKVTLWDAFRYLYTEKAPQGSGRRNNIK